MSLYDMLPINDALNIVLRVAKALPTEHVATAEADGRILAEEIHSPENVPPFRASTVDGFAVIASDHGVPRRVVDNITAGVADRPAIQAGTAARIMTGAPLPDGADAVEMIEYSQLDDGLVSFDRPVKPGENVRPIGIDVSHGDLVLRPGTILGAAEIGLLMTLGVTQVPCYRRPTVAVLSTGDELVEPGEPMRPGAIRDSNRYALMTAIREAGGIPISLGRAIDDRELQTRMIREGVDRGDVLITSGGVSVGDRDFIKPALEELGTVHFGRINFRPGMPLTFAEIGPKLVFGLPGNPVSSLVTFESFVRPALRLMQGDPHPRRPLVEVELEHEFRRPGGRLEYHRAIVRYEGGRLRARSTGLQISSRLLSMVGSNAMVILVEGEGILPAGTIVPALLTGPIQND
jgi:molybdopterin molybdotransferase